MLNTLLPRAALATLASTFLIGPGSTKAQSFSSQALFVEEAAGTVCTLPAVLEDRNVRTVPDRSTAKTAAPASTISVTYVDEMADPWPAAAMTAFDFAAAIWEEAVTSAVTIEVEANWADLGGCTGMSISLGSAGAVRRWREFGVGVAGTWYVDALADALVGTDLCTLVNPSCAGDPDIIANFNRECDDVGASVTWYFGTDGNPPVGQTDFVTVVLHELGHGLGFAGAGDVTGGSGTVLRNGFPIIYDQFTEDGVGTSLLTGYTDGSAALKTALEGGASGVFFDATNATSANGGSPPELYAPGAWEAGSSYSHLDESTFDATTNALMTPQLASSEAIHVLGSITCGMFEDMGWTIAPADCDVALPVELVSFDATPDGRDVLLSWVTLSERNNAGFEIAHVSDGDYRKLDFVSGAGTSQETNSYHYRITRMPVGVNRLRLTQIDFDGTAQVLGEIDVATELLDAFELTEAYPNPFNPQTTFYVTARIRQPARVEVYDLAGRRMAVLFDGVLDANSPRKMVVDATGWPSGMYLYRVQAEQFASSGRIVLLK